MEDYMKERPKRKPFSMELQRGIIKRVREFVLKDLLPNPDINRIILFGSLARGEFGRYEGPFQGRIYSDIDILLLVEDDFEPRRGWELHFEGRMYNVYNTGKLDGFLVQYMVCRRSVYEDPDCQREAEDWGVPLLLRKSRHRYIVLYEKRTGFLKLLHRVF
jgi:predicted nucleotidyltransferase